MARADSPDALSVDRQLERGRAAAHQQRARAQRQQLRRAERPLPLLGSKGRFTYTTWAFPAAEFANTALAYKLFCKEYYARTGFRCDMPAVELPPEPRSQRAAVAVVRQRRCSRSARYRRRPTAGTTSCSTSPSSRRPQSRRAVLQSNAQRVARGRVATLRHATRVLQQSAPRARPRRPPAQPVLRRVLRRDRSPLTFARTRRGFAAVARRPCSILSARRRGAGAEGRSRDTLRRHPWGSAAHIPVRRRSRERPSAPAPRRLTANPAPPLVTAAQLHRSSAAPQRSRSATCARPQRRLCSARRGRRPERRRIAIDGPRDDRDRERACGEATHWQGAGGLRTCRRVPETVGAQGRAPTSRRDAISGVSPEHVCAAAARRRTSYWHVCPPMSSPAAVRFARTRHSAPAGGRWHVPAAGG